MKYYVIQNSTYISFSLSEKGLPVGVAECSTGANNEWYFNRLFVRPNYRRKGYGTKLLTKLLKLSKEIGITIRLDINPYGEMNYEQLEKFYLQKGFIKYMIDGNPVYFFNKRKDN